jgi:gamma-glutamylputrescine oxidase
MKLQNWWFTTLLGTQEPIQPPLKKNIKTDVVIIGGGAGGLSAAYFFLNKGLKVVILERNICGGNSSGKSAGFLTPDSELELSQLIRRFGVTGAADLWKVATTGVEMMASQIKNHNIVCDFQVQDSLFLGLGKSDWRDIKEEMKSRNLLKFDQRLYSEEELKSIIGSEGYSGAVRYSGTYGIDALLYCQGMKKLLLDSGVEIYESSEVTFIKENPGS